MYGHITILYASYIHISLNIELNDDGYLEGEWFCKGFVDKDQSPQAFKTALEEYSKVQNELEENVLYRAYQEEYLNTM